MDPLYYTRIAMAGWIFMAVILVSLWGSNNPRWDEFLQLMHGKSDTVALLVFGAVVGIGAPPALGFLLEKVAATIMRAFRRNVSLYCCGNTFAEILRKALEGNCQLNLPEVSQRVFQVFFYSSADPKFLDWSRRRTTQTYASLTSALAIIFALVVANLMFHAFSWPVDVIALLLALNLTVHGMKESRLHEQTLDAWVNTIGVTLSNDFAKQLARTKQQS